MKQPFFSICIPVWEAKGKGVDYLEYNLTSIKNQVCTDFEVVISDHSVDNVIEEYVKRWRDLLTITYVKCEAGRGRIAPNVNTAIQNAKGKYIKFLYQDDFFFNESSLQTIKDYLTETKDVSWAVTGCTHTADMETIYDTMTPRYNSNIHLGYNTISSPSVLVILNRKDNLLFDESLKFLDDVEYYKRNYIKYGPPHIINTTCVVNREGGVRATSMLTNEIRQQEVEKIKTKYSQKIELPNVTLVCVTSVDVPKALQALKYSCKGINFSSTKLITSCDVVDEEVEIIKCRPLDYEQYSYFILYELWQHITTDYALIIQEDGYVVNPSEWTDAFLDYDYIGAPWPLPTDSFSFRDRSGVVHRVGNGGFTLRSKKVLELPSKLGLEWKSFHGYYNEDGFICVNYRHIFDEHNCKIAPLHIASYFSHETNLPETQGITPFGFHGRANPYYKTLN